MKRYRFFKAGVPHHVYVKAENSFILFYTQEDVILYFTLYSGGVDILGDKITATD